MSRTVIGSAGGPAPADTRRTALASHTLTTTTDTAVAITHDSAIPPSSANHAAPARNATFSTAKRKFSSSTTFARLIAVSAASCSTKIVQIGVLTTKNARSAGKPNASTSSWAHTPEPSANANPASAATPIPIPKHAATSAAARRPRRARSATSRCPC